MSPLNIKLIDSPEHRDLIRRLAGGNNIEAIEEFTALIQPEIDRIIFELMPSESFKNKSTGHKDFFGKELFLGDKVALLQKSGSSSVYIRKGVITGQTNKMVKVKFSNQFGGDDDSSRDPQNVIKA